MKAYPELNPLGIKVCWQKDSGSGERLPAGRRLRERADILSIWLRYDTSRKLYLESKDYPHNCAVSGNITPWVKQVPCLHLANLSTKVAKAGCSTVYTVTFRAMIWHSLKQVASQSQSSLVFDEPGIKALVGERWEQMERFSVLWNPRPRPPRVTTCEGSCKIVQRKEPCRFCWASRMPHFLPWHWGLIPYLAQNCIWNFIPWQQMLISMSSKILLGMTESCLETGISRWPVLLPIRLCCVNRWYKWYPMKPPVFERFWSTI